MELSIIYGSQTGTAEAIATEFHEMLLERTPIKSHLYCADEIETKFKLQDLQYTVFIFSTTGDGDPPDNATKLWRKLRRLPEPLPELKYALLGLGDTNYSNFCGCAVALEKKLVRANCSPFFKTAFADDAVGLEEVVEKWLKELIDLLKAINDGVNMDVANQEFVSSPNVSRGALALPRSLVPFLNVEIKDRTSDKNVNSNFGWKKQHFVETFKCTINEITQLTHADALKKTLLFELDLKDHPMNYQPGDAFGVICPNNQAEVNWILERLKLDTIKEKYMTIKVLENTTKKDASVPAFLNDGITVQDYFLKCADIRSHIKKTFLKLLAEFCSDEKEKYQLEFLSSKEGATEYKKILEEHKTDLVSLLCTYSSCQPPLERIIECLPPLLPRYYSACSTPLENPRIISFVFSVTEFESERPFNKGVATGWLESLMGDVQNGIPHSLELFVKPSPHFRLPEDLNRPIVMVGPGTGVAPFIGFLQHRERQIVLASKTAHEQLNLDAHSQLSGVDDIITGVENMIVDGVGETWLFYGCRNPELDFIFEKEINGFVKNKTLNNLVTCFSRQNEIKRYVQDGMVENAKKIYDLMIKDGLIYVCGDGLHMAKDVDSAILQILKLQGLSDDKALELISEWNRTHRIIRDVWH